MRKGEGSKTGGRWGVGREMSQEPKERREEADKLHSMAGGLAELPGYPSSCWVCPKGKELKAALIPRWPWAHASSDPRGKPPCLHTQEDSWVQPHITRPWGRAVLEIYQPNRKLPQPSAQTTEGGPKDAGPPTDDTMCHVVGHLFISCGSVSAVRSTCLVGVSDNIALKTLRRMHRNNSHLRALTSHGSLRLSLWGAGRFLFQRIRRCLQLPWEVVTLAGKQAGKQ